ncbi:hypothetical protein [Microvirga massiliensis]|uniref:hypothetical protein n=1 Tax=Microvirga massiliensis TaxID=1033741 RepID=UPI000660E92F|nr:hypothetical protein [Microvirga massiliensis]
MSYHRNVAIAEDKADLAELDFEAQVREAYDACHPNDSFSALKQRARFSKEASGLYRGWMRAARSGALGMIEKRTQPDADAKSSALAA